MWLPPALRVSTNDDGLVLLNVETGQIFTANEVGSRIWRLLDEGRAIDEIAVCIADLYGQPHATVAEDVREFVGGLQTLGVRPVL